MAKGAARVTDSSIFPNEELLRGRSRTAKRELPAPHFVQPDNGAMKEGGNKRLTPEFQPEKVYDQALKFETDLGLNEW